jgi:hypothetical protein
MPFDNSKELPYLIGFCLAANLLQVQHLWHAWVLKDVMASTYAGNLETESSNQPYHIREGDVAELTAAQTCEEFLAVHSTQRRRNARLTVFGPDISFYTIGTRWEGGPN